MKMKKILNILSAGAILLGLASCIKEEVRVVFDPSQSTAPVIESFVENEGDVEVTFTPGSMNVNGKISNHWLALVSVDGKPVSKSLTSTVKDGVAKVTATNLSKALVDLGCEDGAKVNVELIVRASPLGKSECRDDAPTNYIDSKGRVELADYLVVLPSGDPYARFVDVSEWGLVGSFNGWGNDPDVEMYTNGTLHVAKAVTLAAGDEVKFRKNSSWDVNLGFADGVTSYVLDEEFSLSQGGANIKIAEDGVYDLLLDPESATAKIIKSAVPQDDPYAAYTEISAWGVIGSFNSWGSDVEMVTNGTLHVCKNITLAAGDEFKFRKDGSWDVNYGYGTGVDSYELGVEFAASQGGGNIKIAEDGAYDLILDPENETIKIIKTQAVTVDPYAAYTEISTWGVVGNFNSWGSDVEMVTNGTLHVAKAVSLSNGDEFKFRKDAGWTVNFGYADGVETYTLGEEFGLKQDGSNIKVLEAGVYDLILDPENETAKIIVSVAKEAGDTPAPKPKPTAWSIIGSLNDTGWETDYDLTNTSGDTWVIKKVAFAAGDEFLIRANHEWGTKLGGPEKNATSTIDPSKPYDVYAPTIGTAFTAGDLNIRIDVAGEYNVTITYGETSTVLIEEYKEYPEHLYMTGADFGNWFGDQSGVVELTPVLHNPAWGANAEGQFWTVRYFKAASGFKFNSAPSWDGNDFNSLETNDGFTVSEGNCFVPSDGFYMVHIDFKRSILHIEPAQIRIIGDCTGMAANENWDEEKIAANAGTLFQADGQVLKLTLPAGGKLRMYAVSAISTSDAWTREFNIYENKIVYRGNSGDQEAVNVRAEQVVTLDFNAGTGSITGEGVGPAYKDVISVPGNWSEWTADAPKLGGDTKGLYKGVLAMYGDAIEFKFIHDGSWIGGTAGEGLNYTLGASDNMTIAAGTYFWTVDLVSNTASAVAVNKVGLMGTFNGWADDKEVFLTEQADHTYTGSVTLAADDSLKVRLNSNWDLALGGALDALSGVGGDIKVATAGTYQVKLDFNARTLTLIPADN